jgi:cell division FtsZ-interacting protein ZapD
MKSKIKNLGACEDELLSILALSKLGSEQRKTLNRVRKKLNRAKQNERITREEVFEVIRELAEALIESNGSMK